MPRRINREPPEGSPRSSVALLSTPFVHLRVAEASTPLAIQLSSPARSLRYRTNRYTFLTDWLMWAFPQPHTSILCNYRGGRAYPLLLLQHNATVQLLQPFPVLPPDLDPLFIALQQVCPGHYTRLTFYANDRYRRSLKHTHIPHLQTPEEPRPLTNRSPPSRVCLFRESLHRDWQLRLLGSNAFEQAAAWFHDPGSFASDAHPLPSSTPAPTEPPGPRPVEHRGADHLLVTPLGIAHRLTNADFPVKVWSRSESAPNRAFVRNGEIPAPVAPPAPTEPLVSLNTRE